MHDVFLFVDVACWNYVFAYPQEQQQQRSHQEQQHDHLLLFSNGRNDLLEENY